MPQNLKHLFQTKRFLPLFLTQFLGAFNDNAFKNALVFLFLAKLGQTEGQLFVNIAAGLFIFPFFLFSATAGQLADKYEKGHLIRLIKIAEIGIMALAGAGLYFENTYFLFAVLFLMGTQSAFFGPLKYAILPEHLKEDELIGGNGLIEAGTFLAILLGTIAGGLLILAENGAPWVTSVLLAVALFGWIASWRIPKAGPAAPGLKINWNVLTETKEIVSYAASHRTIFLSILGISWFWLVGATFVAQIPSFAKHTLGAQEEIGTLFLTVFSVGIGLGSLWCNRLLKGEVSAKYVPIGALGMSIGAIDLYFASTASLVAPGTELLGLSAFLADWQHCRVLADLLAISVFGGLYIVPLYAIMQHESESSHRARVIASNNVLNALFMVIAVLGTLALIALGVSIPGIFLTLAILNFGVAIYICKLLPDALVKAFFAGIFRFFYRAEIKGLENYPKTSERVLIIANHVSFLDGMLLAAFLPFKPTFAINTFMARRWFMKPFGLFVDLFPIDPTNPMSTKSLIKVVQSGKPCVIFPEGRLTVTGALMKVYEGPGMIADKAKADIVPIRIDGAQYTTFSRLRGKLRLRWFPKVTMTVLPPKRFDIDEDIKGRARRQQIGNALYDVMCDVIFETCDRNRTLFEALCDAQVIHGGKSPVAEDMERKPLSYKKLILGSRVLGRRLAAQTDAERPVGMLLPNAAGTAVTFFALQAFGRVPAMLNFSAGQKSMEAACHAAGIETIVTSRRFVKMAKLSETVKALSDSRQVIYLEDLRKRLTLADKLLGLVTRPFALAMHRKLEIDASAPAVVLFTSGSEGTPKGVVLSHANLLSNLYQLSARIDFNPTDVVFNAMPVFHSFGLTAGMLLPMFSGIKTFLYPSPLHYRIVPELIYDCNATIMFGTDTFLTGYARVAHAYDFYSVRYVFAGAEKVKEETRRVWSEKFGLRILEGYGATETAPVLTTNTPMHFKAGSVGRFLPGIEYRLNQVPGIDRGGRLLVKGPNVMLGYYRAETPLELEPPEDGWYDTGDIVDIDEAGFVTICGRAKRFAKIAGEMVSLSAVEEQAAALWPEAAHAVVSLPDPRKGEQLILLTSQEDANRGGFLAHAQEQGLTELMVPKTILAGTEVPLLATGKVDYVTAKTKVESLVETAA